MRGMTVLIAVMMFGAASASAQTINDAQIAAIVVTANQIDVDAGKLATTKGESDAVKKFGQLMVTDHMGVNKAAGELAAKLKVVPQANATSDSLKKAAAAHMEKLKGLSGAAFDRAYIDHEVAYHQHVLDALDKTLIPGASNAELKALLVKVRPAFVAHLEHAKSVQKTVATER
jgi:putative membrane protein